MPEQPRGQIALAAIRVDDRADQLAGIVHGLRHRVDGQVAPDQVVFQRDIGRAVEREALVAGSRLALGTRERVLLLGARMQEDREVLAHGLVAGRLHLGRRGAHHHVVAVLAWLAQQLVADGAAHGIDLHEIPSDG
ncbi:hypothetical protein D3C87_1721580 [compost metagenome]